MSQDDPIVEQQSSFQGEWLPDADSTKIGLDNFKTLQNVRYVNGGVQGTLGCTKINTSAISGTPVLETGVHLKKDNPSETHVIVAADDGKVYQNTTAIPSQGGFSVTELHTEASGAGDPRFSQAPGGHIAYANEQETMIWGGDEIPCGAFITSTDDVVNSPTNPKDYTKAVSSSLQTAGNTAVIGGISSNTKGLWHCDGSNGGTTFTDSSGNGHTLTANGDTNTDTSQKKFGLSSAGMDGTGDYLSKADHADFELGNNNFTIDFWWRPAPGVPGVIGQNLAAKWLQAGDQRSWVLFYKNDNSLSFSYSTDGTAGTVTTLNTGAGTVAPSASTWYHVEVDRDGANLYIFLNGSLAGGSALNVSTDTFFDGTADLDFGNNQTEVGNAYLNGHIDEIRFINGDATHTSNFTAPSEPYATAALTWLVGSARPLQGVKFCIANANSRTSTLSVSTWYSGGWVSLTATDNTASGGVTLAQTGTVTWTSTVGAADPKYIDGKYLYWYKFTASAGEATIYKATLDAPWQDIVDIWDGVYRQPIQFQVYAASIYEDYTAEVNANDSTYFADLGGLLNTEHAIVVFEERVTAIKLTMVAGSVNTNAATVTVYYWNGDSWMQVEDVSDGTFDSGGTKSLNQSGVIAWTAPPKEQEFPQTLFGYDGYAYKLVWSAQLSADADINLATAVPAQVTIPPCKFTAIFKDRLFLCGLTEMSKGNACYFSMTGSAQVFNGTETSNNGLYALEFGGEEELSAAVEIYNKVGSNIYAFFLVLKDNETYSMTGDGPDNFLTTRVSDKVGCPAPRSLDTAEVGYEVTEGARQQIAIWLSYAGPVGFNGTEIFDIPGISSYFDPEDDNFVGAANIETAFGWFDPTYKEYNLRVSTYWFVYDLVKKKWFEKDTTQATAAVVNCAFPVKGTDGTQYIYSGNNAGIMHRQENGYTWDGQTITHTIETGDFWPTKSIWNYSILDFFKYMGVRDNGVTSNITVTHYVDGATSGTTIATIARNTGSARFFRDNQSLPERKAWTHRLKFTATSSGTPASDLRWKPLGWAIQARDIRKDR